MTEEVTEEINTKTVSNGDSPTVSPAILQNMRRGLFGKSAGSQEEAPVNTSSTTQEHSNGSVDTDDPMKNGISFEDKEELSQKHQPAEQPVVADESPVVEEVPPETETASDGESTAVIIEEPKDGSVKSVNSPGNPLLDLDNAEGADQGDDIEITEVESVDNATPHETFTVPVVIQSSSASPRNIEVSEESVEVPITETNAMETTSADEEAQPTQDEAKLDEEASADGAGEPEVTEEGEQVKEIEKEDETVEKMEVEEQTEEPKSGRRSRRAAKEDAPKETPTKTPRGRRGAAKEEETPSRRSLRGKPATEAEEVEETGEEEEKEEEVEEEPVVEKKTPARKTPKRGQKVEEEKEEEKEDEEEQEKVSEDEEPVTPAKRGSRARKGKGKTPAKKKEEKPKEEEEAKEEETKEEEEEEAPVTRRSTRRGRIESKGPSEKSEDDEAVAETPKRATRRGQAKNQEEEPETKEDEEEQMEEKTPSRTTRRSTRGTPRGIKVEVVKEEEKEVEEEEEEDKEEEDDEEEEPVPEKRARRGAKTAVATPKSAGRASARRGAQKKAVKEEDEEETDDKTVTPKGKKGKGEKKSEEFDPYDVDTQLDLHPDPLKNVVVSGGLFGTHKYGKIGSGKYTFTEKAAEERIGNLGDLVPKQVTRRSLADLTPGRRRNTPKGAKSAPPARKKKDVESDEEMDVDQPGSSKATPTTSRKRKTSTDGGGTAKKAAIEVELPSLNDEEQWFADHPPDEHAPIQIGARVYAVFSKIYYPAVIVAERDGLGRYKVQFVEDSVVRDIPAQGIVPLRAVVAEKECYYEDDSAVIIACPNAASSKEWAAAVFTIRRLDAQGEVTGNDVKCGWSKLSLDMNDWKDYIHQKSIEATSVATDNIAHTRTRRSHAEPAPASSMTAVPTKSPKKGAKKTARGRSNAKGGDETEATEEEHDRNIFAGMVFLLTSAQRDGNSSFKKKMLVDCIVERQGTVVEDFNEMDQHPDCRHFLISDTYYRTHKYLAALAKGVPCISHEWIHKCIETESVVDNSEYILPAGKSSINDDEYPAPRQNSRILSGKNILIYSGNQLSNPKAINYYQIWEPLVSYMGGRPFKGLNDIGPDDKLDIVLTDNSVTDAMLRRAAKDEAWVVTSEWLINVIIMDRLVDPDSFPRFKVQRAAQLADEE